MRQGASYISAAKPQKCYCMGSMNVVLANVALASAVYRYSSLAYQMSQHVLGNASRGAISSENVVWADLELERCTRWQR